MAIGASMVTGEAIITTTISNEDQSYLLRPPMKPFSVGNLIETRMTHFGA
jgi:hypothetical protein